MITSIAQPNPQVTRANHPLWSAPPGAKSGPPDVATLSGLTSPSTPAEPSALSQHGRTAALVALGIVGVGVAAGVIVHAAGSTPPAPAPEVPAQTCVSEHYQAGDLSFEVIPLEAPRVDVYRASHTVAEGQATREVPNDYSPFGVYLGDGLFYDLNGNLSLVPQRMQDGPLVPQDASKVSVDPWGWFNSTDATRHGSRVNVNPTGFRNSTDITVNGCRVSIDPTGWNNEITIQRNGNVTTIDPYGWNNEIQIRRGESQIQVDPFGIHNEVDVNLRSNGANVDPIGFNNDTDVSAAPGRATINPPGIIDGTSITREGDTIRINHPGIGFDTTITVGENSLEIDPPGWNNSTTIRWKK